MHLARVGGLAIAVPGAAAASCASRCCRPGGTGRAWSPAPSLQQLQPQTVAWQPHACAGAQGWSLGQGKRYIYVIEIDRKN